MSIVRLEAYRRLALQIEAAIPDLRDQTRVMQVPPDQSWAAPCLAIIPPEKHAFYRQQESEHDKPTPSSLVVEVGWWTGTAQLRLAHATPAQRNEFEEKITQLFWQRENAGGVLLSPVTACRDYGRFTASWELEDSGWDDEFAFSSQHWSVSELSVTIPALVTRQGVYAIDDLRLGLTQDFTTPATSAAFDAMPGHVRVNEDGTITPL